MYFRTVRTVDPITGKGEIKLDVSGNSVRFRRDMIASDPEIQPIVGECLTYRVVRAEYQPAALDLQRI